MKIAIRVENLDKLVTVGKAGESREVYHVGYIIDPRDPTSLLAGVACLEEDVVRI